MRDWGASGPAPVCLSAFEIVQQGRLNVFSLHKLNTLFISSVISSRFKRTIDQNLNYFYSLHQSHPSPGLDVRELSSLIRLFKHCSNSHRILSPLVTIPSTQLQPNTGIIVDYVFLKNLLLICCCYHPTYSIYFLFIYFVYINKLILLAADQSQIAFHLCSHK